MHKKILQEHPKGLKNMILKKNDTGLYIMRVLAIDTRQPTIFRIFNTIFRILNTIFRMR